MHKILIIPEKEEDNLYNLLPLIKGIEVYFSLLEEDFKIYIFHGKDISSQAALIKGRVNFHLFKDEEIGPLGSLKVVQRQKDIFNLTHSFCYRDDVGAVTLHKYFKARNRYGYQSIQGKFVNTHQMDRPNIHRKKEHYFALLSHFFDVSFEDVCEQLKKDLKSYEDIPENFFKAAQVDPFLFLVFDKIEEESEAHLLLQSMSHNFDQRIYLWVGTLNEITKKLFRENENLLDISQADPLSFDAYLDKCLGVITNESWVSEMASYFGRDNLLFGCKDLLRSDFANPNTMLATSKGPGFYDLLIVDGDEKIEDINIDLLNDKIHDFFSL